MWRDNREEIGANSRAGEEGGEGVLAEERRIASDRHCAAVVDRVERKRRQADERVAEKRDPPGERVATHLLDLGHVEWELRVVVVQRADMRPGAEDSFARETTRVGAQAAPVCSDSAAEVDAVPDN